MSNFTVIDVETEAGDLASQATQVADSEAKLVTRFQTETHTLPLYTPLPEGRLMGWISTHDATKRLKEGSAELFRDRHGAIRRIYLADKQHVPTDEGKILSSITSQASRTVRREQLGNTHSCYSHIMGDLTTKKLITQEELVADGIFQGVK